MIQISVAEAKPEHSEEVCNVLKQSINELCAPDYNYDENILNDWLANKTPENVKNWIESKTNYSLVALTKENEIVGFILMSESGEILLNYVLPQYKNQGIGKHLLNSLELYAKNLGLRNIRTVSTITAKSFYERNGFVKNGEPMYVGSILGDFPLIKELAT